jgi:hypothetical protein
MGGYSASSRCVDCPLAPRVRFNSRPAASFFAHRPSTWRTASPLETTFREPRPGVEGYLKESDPASVGIDSFTDSMCFFV